MAPQPTTRWPDRMNATDALFWSMDKIPDMRSTIGALVILESLPTRDRFHQEYERISRHLVRMRQRVVEVPLGLAPPEWVDDLQFDLAYHVRYIAVPEPGGLEELLEEISPLYATALDPNRPLWETYVVEGLAGGRGAVFVKMHHCLIDGVGGSRLFESLLSERREAGAAVVQVPRPPQSTEPIDVLSRALRDDASALLRGGRAGLRAVAEALRAPRTTLKAVRRGLRMVTGFGRELIVPRAHSPLHRARSLSRRLSTFEVALADVDAVRQPLGATNNDIVLTVVSGALRRWHAMHGAKVKELRALVPVSVRGAEEVEAGNRIGLLAVGLPVGEADPLRRLRAIQRRMGQIKADQRARLYPWLARVMTALPLPIAERIGRQQTNRTNFVCTNVPGPRRTCYLAGAAIERIYPYAPLVGDHPVAVALYSYRDTMYLGLDVDPLAMDDLSRFRQALQDACLEVLHLGRRGLAKRGKRRPTRRRQPRRRHAA
jgi:diacylglycerol O-acyltransferase / wax synthase